MAHHFERGITMKLTGKLKKQVEKAQTKEEAREAIKKAGMLLDDDNGMVYKNMERYLCSRTMRSFYATNAGGVRCIYNDKMELYSRG